MGVAKITQANSYGAWGEELPTLSYLKSAWKVDNFKFTGKESLQGTGFTDFGARWYDNIVPRFTTIDPLSEISRRFSPYAYANDNPLRFIDPDGMAAQTIKDFNGNSHTVGDNEMTTIYQAPIEDDKSKANVNTSAEYDKLKTGTNITSGIYSGTKLDEVVIKGKKLNTFDQAISIFGSAGYNKRYFPRVANDHNDYGPLRPFALNGFQVQYNLPFAFYGGFGYVSFKGSGSFYTVYNPLQVAGSPSLVAGASPQLASMKEGLSFNMFVGNPLTSNTTLDDFGGWSGSISGQYSLGVGYSRALEFNNGNRFAKSVRGFETFNLTFGLEAGGGAEISRTTLLK